MLPKKPRHILYALLLMTLSVVCTTALANTKVITFFTEVASVLETATNDATPDERVVSVANASVVKSKTNIKAINAPMFATIIQGADEEVTCANDGSTIARFILCGDSDDRIVSLQGAPFSSVSWEQLSGGCTPDMSAPCPQTGCSYTQVQTGQQFTLDASTISATTGGEYRVQVNGTGPYYYFEISKSTINQQYVKTDAICGNLGAIQITHLSPAWEFSMDSGSGFGSWQGPIFNTLAPGIYNIKARLQGVPNGCEYPYAPIEILQQDITIDVAFTDAQCSGDTGSVTVTANGVPGPYKYTLLDASGTPQEFTTFITDNPYTFSAVGFGTYTVQVETQQCTGDPGNGIDPPR